MLCQTLVDSVRAAGRRYEMPCRDARLTAQMPNAPGCVRRIPLQIGRGNSIGSRNGLGGICRARSSAVEHYVDIVGVTGSIPVAPTSSGRSLRSAPNGASRAVKTGKGHEGQEFAALAEIAPPGMPRRAPEGTRVRHQQAPEEIQGAPRLSSARSRARAVRSTMRSVLESIPRSRAPASAFRGGRAA